MIQIGLTPNQGKLYLTLLRIGKATGNVISKETGLARQEIYRLLNELHTRGLIEKIINVPTEFQAAPIEEGVSILMMEKTREAEQTRERINSLIDEYANIKGKTITEKEYKLVMIPPKKLSFEPRESMIKNSKQTIQLISTNRRISQSFANFFDSWEKTLKRKINAQIVIVGEESKFHDSSRLNTLRGYPNFAVKFTSKPSTGLLIVDESEAIVTLNPKVDLGASPVLWTNHPELLSIYTHYFVNLWTKTKNTPSK